MPGMVASMAPELCDPADAEDHCFSGVLLGNGSLVEAYQTQALYETLYCK